jgi:hypothetical protein
MQFLLPIFFSLKKRCQDVKVTTVFLQRVQPPGFKVFGLTEKQDARRGDDFDAMERRLMKRCQVLSRP